MNESNCSCDYSEVLKAAECGQHESAFHIQNHAGVNNDNEVEKRKQTVKPAGDHNDQRTMNESMADLDICKKPLLPLDPLKDDGIEQGKKKDDRTSR
jgi:hypothetical protein